MRDTVTKKCVVVFFFFKQKTAYEMLRSLVGSEMCIRDRFTTGTEEDWDQACEIIMDCIGVINKANITLHTRAIVLTMLEKLAKDQNEAWEADFIKRSIGAPND